MGRMVRLNTYLIFFLSAILVNGLAARLHSHHRHQAHYRHQAHHRHLNDEVIHGVRLESEEKEVMMRAGEQPIRFYLHYGSITPALRGRVETIMNNVMEYFPKLLKVKPIQVPILLDRSCPFTSRYIGGQRYCDSYCATTTRCYDFEIPKEHLKPCRSCQGTQCTISATDPKNAGVSNADYIIYVTADSSSLCRSGTAGAYASVCQTESSLDRPVAGRINFCESEIDANTLEYMTAVAKHEMIHALVFSPQLYPFFRDQNGNPRVSRDPITNLPLTLKGSTDYDVRNVVATYTHTNWAVASGTISHEVKIVITPTVLAKARAHFNCPTMPGLELENQGGPTSAMSHWEARVVGNELMAGTNAFSARLSELTLALLQDSGWYQVDFSLAEPLLWGKNAGCQFVLGSCGGYINSRLSSGRSTEPFCTTPTDVSKPLKLGCTVDRDSTGYCNLVKQTSPLPRDYQYFPQYGPEFGGIVEKRDYCPFYEVFNYVDKRGTYCADEKNNPKGTNFLGESYGPGTSCLYEGSKGWSVTNVATNKVIERVPNNYGAGCYKVSSARGVTTITVLNKAYQCAQSGQQIDVDVTLNGLRYKGSLLCP